MRVLLVTDWPEAGGGVETYVMQIARGLREAGDDVRLLTSSVGGGPAQADYVAFGSRNRALQSVLQIANPAAGAAVRRAIDSFKPDAAHVSMFEMHLSPSVLSALRGVPTVLNIAYYKPVCPNGLKLLPDDSRCTARQGTVCWRGGCTPLAHWLRDRVRYARIGREVASVASVVTCSDWLQRELRAAGIESAWSPWPVEPPGATFLRSPTADPLFVFTGRLAREKGVATLLRAIALVRDRGVVARLRVVGDGPERPALDRLTGKLGIQDLVEFTGWVPLSEVEAHLSGAWALVAPSTWAEPLGLTALEAIVRGIPVVASAAGGFAETVEPGVSGLLFPNGDAEALSRCLVDIATGHALVNGVPRATAEALMARHHPDAHLAWLRALLAEIAA